MPAQRTIGPLEELRHTPHICMAESLRAANRVVTKLYADQLADIGVSPAQASLLMRLYYLREATVLQLAGHMETDRTTLGRNVDVLRRSGYVEVGKGDDRRRKMIRLSELGYSVLESAMPRWQEAQRRLLAAVGEEMWGSLLTHTRTIAELGAREDHPVDP